MDSDFQLINHCLFKNVVVLFVLPEELKREQFEQCVRFLQEKENTRLTEHAFETYWTGIEKRQSGCTSELCRMCSPRSLRH